MFVPSVEAVQIAIELLDQYKHEESINDALDPNYKSVSLEDVVKKYLAESLHPREVQDVAIEFFFRICKYRKYLDIVLNKFIESKSSWTTINSKDMIVYTVFIYLLVIELNELTRIKVEEILMSINARKALALVTFFKRKSILTKLYEWGCQIWDVDYVTNLLQNIIKDPVFDEVYDTVTGHMQKIKKSKIKALTVPVGPKCLSRPRHIVSRHSTEVLRNGWHSITRIPVSVKKASGTPKTTYAKPTEIGKLEEERLKHREEAKCLLEEARSKAFRCATLEKSQKFKELEKKIEEERQAEFNRKTTYKKIKSKSFPSPKKTAAVILRDGARLLKLESDEIKKYEDVANGGFNVDLIAEWEEEMREERFRKHVEDIERKHLEGLLSYEEALLAKQKCLVRKKEQADEFKKEKETWMKQLEEWRREEQARLQEAFEREKALEKGAREAVEQVKEEKHKIAMETAQESKALYERRMKEVPALKREEDLQKKVQMIREIKALQALHGIKRKQLNLSETANLGFLCEMSIAELKERLFLLRLEVQEELEKRRTEIKAKRECRKEIIAGYQDLIESHRQLAREQSRISQRGSETAKAENRTKTEKAQSSTCLDNLRRKLYEKRMERHQHEILLRN